MMVYLFLQLNTQSSPTPSKCIRIGFNGCSDLASWFSTGNSSYIQTINWYQNGNYNDNKSRFLDVLYDFWNVFNVNSCDNSYVYNGYQIRPSMFIKISNSDDLANEKALLTQLLTNVRLRVSFGGNIGNTPIQGLGPHYCYWDCVLTGTGGDEAYPLTNNSGWICQPDIDIMAQKNTLSPYADSLLQANCLYDIRYGDETPSDCIDKRSSLQNQIIHIVLSGKKGEEVSNFTYDLGINCVVGGSNDTVVTIPNQMTRHFTELIDVEASFTNGIVRDDGVLKIYGYINGCGVFENPFGITQYNNSEVLLCQLSFNKCCDSAITCSITYLDELEDLIGEPDNFTGDITLSKFVYNGFGFLTDFCCDEFNDCDDNSFSFPSNNTLIGGNGGGGDNVDITCICDNLLLIKTAIEANGLKIDGLTDSIDGLTVGVDTTNLEDKLDTINTTLEGFECICDNLESIDNTIINKDLLVTNNFSPTTNVAAPVVNNNVPVPSVNNNVPVPSVINNVPSPSVTVNADLSTINSNISHLSNLSNLSNLSELSDLSNLSNIAGGTVDIADSNDYIKQSIDLVKSAIDNLELESTTNVDTSDLSCDGQSIACILKDLNDKFKITYEDETEKNITEVLDSKELEPVNDITIESQDWWYVGKARFNEFDDRT